MAQLQSILAGGLFQTREEAERAVTRLERAGFHKEEIGIAVREGGEGARLAREEGARQERETQPDFWRRMRTVFGHEPATTTAMDLSRAFSGDRAHYFVEGVSRGKVLVTVRAAGREAEAERILRESGADVGAVAKPAAAIPAAPRAAATPPPEFEHQRVQLVGEVLRVVKERVPAGEARIRKEVVNETQTVQIPISREEVVVEREPGGGQPAGRPVAEGQEIRIPLTREEVRVEKEPVVEGVVDVAKKKVEEVKTFTEKLRHEKAEVEETGEEARPGERKPPSERAA